MRPIDAEYLLYGMGMFSERENGKSFMDGVNAVAYMIENAETIESTRPDWTPCEKELPTSTDYYWVTYLCSGEALVNKRAYYAHENHWGVGGKPVAWMPAESKPEPYNPDHIRDTTKKVEDDEWMRDAMDGQLHPNGN